MPHGGELAARALRAAGVRTVFAVPGEHVLHLLDGCVTAGIRVVDTRHEGAAALAAEGWALATGEPGVAIVTAGPGFANALIGLIDAGAWTLPLVLLAGRTGLDRQGRGAVMDIDQEAVARPVAKATLTATRAGQVPQLVADAVRLARAGRPGPVYVEVPLDLYRAELPDPDPEQTVAHEPAGPAAAPGELARAGDLLERAERPLVVAGSGAFWSGAGPAVTRLAEVGALPVTTTSAARGIVPDSHPLCLGSLVHGGAAALSADVVLVLGSAFNANLAYGGAPLFTDDTTVIQVDVSAERLGGNRRADLAVVGDAGAVCGALADAWQQPPDDQRRAWCDRARQLTAAMRGSWDEQIAGHDGDGLHAGAVVRETVAWARERFGDAWTFVTDGGDALAWGLAYGHAGGPGRMMSSTTALGTLGVGLPFALAARAAHPDEPVVVFTGDGSFGLAAIELDTAVRHDLPVVVVVSNNAGWGDVTHVQDRWFGRRVASELAPSRYDRLATALGGHGEHVTESGELRPALDRALASGRAAVVNCATDPAVLSELLRHVGDLGLM